MQDVGGPNRYPPKRYSKKTGATASSDQLPTLTPLRGLAALWVVLYHYSVQCFPSLDATSHTWIIHKGYLAVDMFFMLSGFVMTHVYHRSFAESITRHYRSFLVARVARLYPLHVLMLFMFVTTAFATQLITGTAKGSLHGIPWQGPESVSALIANIFMLQGLDASKLSWNYPAWSISVEFMAYLAFPFALPCIWRASKVTKFAAALALFASLALFAYLKRNDFDQWDGPIVLLRCFPEFLAGTLLYCAFQGGARTSWLSREIAAFGVVAVTVLCLHFDAPDLLIVCLFAALIIVAVLNDGLFARIANIAPLIWLGEVSYSLYLIHGFLQFIANKFFDGFGIEDHADLPASYSFFLLLAMVAVCLITANISYSRVEVVWRQHLRDLLGARRKTRASLGSRHA